PEFPRTGRARDIADPRPHKCSLFWRVLDSALLLLTHPIVRPVTTPSHTAINPSTTLSATFRKANKISPSRKLWNVSSSNVENVVYAPIKPMGIRYRQLAFQCVFSARIVTTRPIKNDPLMLITKVP